MAPNSIRDPAIHSQVLGNVAGQSNSEEHDHEEHHMTQEQLVCNPRCIFTSASQPMMDQRAQRKHLTRKSGSANVVLQLLMV